MNQQRGRRYRAAQEAEQKRRIEVALRERYLAEGREPPAASASAPMDSNVITPGTEFMAMLGRWLRHWAHLKLNEPHTPAQYRIVTKAPAKPPAVREI